jgi:hypothetical protein
VNAQLLPRLDEAHLHVDSLIFEGVRHGAHAALTSVGSHYGNIDFEAIGQGCASRRSESDILAIGSSTAQGAKVLASKVPATTVRL